MLFYAREFPMPCPFRERKGASGGARARPAQRGELHLQERGAADGLERRDRAGDERRLLLEDAVVDRSAEAFVEDLDAEQFRRSRCAVRRK